MKECLFPKEQNIQSRKRKLVLLIIKISGKELREVTKEYEKKNLKLRFRHSGELDKVHI